MNVKIFIGGFPLDIDELQLAKLVAPHGSIEVMKIVRDKRTGICKGYAFIEMTTEQDAISVMAALDGEPMGDRKLTVNIADPVQQSSLSPKRNNNARSAMPPRNIKSKRPRL